MLGRTNAATARSIQVGRWERFMSFSCRRNANAKRGGKEMIRLALDQAAILRLSSGRQEPQLVPHFRRACSSAMDFEVARKASISLSATSKQLQRVRPRGT